MEQAADVDEFDGRIRAMLGDDLLAYALNDVPWVAVDPNDDDRQSVMNAIRNLVVTSEQVTATLPGFSATSEVLRAFAAGASKEAPTATMINTLRVLSGGDLPVAATEDALQDALHDLAVSVFALELAPVEGPNKWMTRQLRNPLINQQFAYGAFCKAVMADESLAPLFSPSAEVEGLPAGFALLMASSDMLIWSTGFAGTVQLAQIGISALEYVYLAMQTAEEFSVDRVGAHAAAAVRIMRSLAGRRTATVKMVVTLSNISIADGVSISLPTGKVIPIGETHRLLVSEVPDSATAALVLDVPLEIVKCIPLKDLHGDSTDAILYQYLDANKSKFDRRRADRDREIIGTRLAFALASPGNERFAPVVRTVRVHHPLSGGSGGWSSGPPTNLTGPGALIGQEEAILVQDWAAKTRHHPSSDVLGARRILAAMSERHDNLDGLVDAVVCWENIIGAKGENTFRISAALAILLAPDDLDERRKWFERARRLYEIRSNVVHASRDQPDPARVQGLRDQAIEIALRAMRAIYGRDELLAEGGEVRNRMVVLGF